jgi:hypothetical protein
MILVELKSSFSKEPLPLAQQKNELFFIMDFDLLNALFTLSRKEP